MEYKAGKIEIRALRQPFFGDRVDFLLLQESGSKRYFGEIVMKEIPPEDEGSRFEPTFRLRPDEAQHLMDALWREGFRPTEGTGSAGALAAVQKHLEDMRTLVFKK